MNYSRRFRQQRFFMCVVVISLQLPCSIVLIAAEFKVTNTKDSGPGSLRDAIHKANTTTDLDKITFAIGVGRKTIRARSQLPTIQQPVTIDGTTQTGFSGMPMIEIDGTGAGAVNGLVVTSGGTTIRGLVINRFNQNGIVLQSNGRNVVEGNFIGTDFTGTVALGNLGRGILIQNGSDFNRIGTDGDGKGDQNERNLISGNKDDGIRIVNSHDNVIAGNYIGTDLSGTTRLRHASANRETIREWKKQRVDLGDGVALHGGAKRNRIGTNGDGTADVAERNLISGNINDGIRIYDSGTHENIIAGNFIGTDITGTRRVSNADDGIDLGNGAQKNRVGTNGDGVSDYVEANLISGNNEIDVANAIEIHGSGVDQNIVAGNLMGVDITGTKPLGNSAGVGISGGAKRNIIGTNGDGQGDAVERNVISGVLGQYNDAIGIGGKGTNENIVAGNFIGTDWTGTAVIGNVSAGIEIHSGARKNRIGTDGNGVSDSLEGNRIIGNKDAGISFYKTALHNVVAGNYITSNGSNGVQIGKDAKQNRIGSDGDGINDAVERNTILNNSAAGVKIDGPSTENTVLNNSINANDGLGIDIQNYGINNNDTSDKDGVQNYPELSSLSGSSNTTIKGKLHSRADTQFRIEFFVSPSVDPTNFGEGEKLLGAKTVSTDANGDVNFDATFGVVVPTGNVVTSTATRLDASGMPQETSEFSKALKK